MTYHRMPALVVTLGVSLTAAWCTLLAWGATLLIVRLARCSIFAARCWMNGAASCSRRTSPRRPQRTRSDMPRKFSARATRPRHHGACLRI